MGKNVARKFKWGQILSAHNFQIFIALPTAVNNDRSLIRQEMSNVIDETPTFWLRGQPGVSVVYFYLW